MNVKARVRMTRAEQQAETRRALLDAAATVFVERGLHGASVEAIAAEAGYSRGAFYSNFESKEQLFAELLQDRVYRRYRAMAESAQRPKGERPSLREFGEQLAAIRPGARASGSSGSGSSCWPMPAVTRASRGSPRDSGARTGSSRPMRSSRRSPRRGSS